MDPVLSAEWIIVYLALIATGSVVVLHEPTLNISEYIDDIYLTTTAEDLAAYMPSDLSTWQSSDENATATIIFTSGTAGRHKGVMLSQKNLVSSAIVGAVKIGKDVLFPEDKTIPLLPMFHMFGITASILSPIYFGLTLHIINDMKYIIQSLSKIRPQILFIVPMIAKTMIDRALVLVQKGLAVEQIKEEMFGGLKMLVCGGATLQTEIIDEYEKFGIQLLNGYGITECSPTVTTSSYDDFVKNSVGRVNDLPNVDVKIFNGTVHVSGDIVMQGYYNCDESPFKMIDGKTWFDTEDNGSIDENGNLYIYGRQSNLIILSDGNNIAPEEIESLFNTHILVHDIMVYEGNLAGKQVIAASILPNYELATAFSEQQLNDEIAKIVDKINNELPTYKRIKTYKIRKTDFNRTSLRKIIRTGVNINE